ncbi:hypothetical protein ACRALDRAFT_1091665 [Sodiomyces alcalophilus JCM 7366]|uniref:uncharacterized protein n=1 Tax=Sodiomyces alcalophilus JCM 7366 TaxID=591952 RepID=UPI0039B3D10F
MPNSVVTFLHFCSGLADVLPGLGGALSRLSENLQGSGSKHTAYIVFSRYLQAHISDQASKSLSSDQGSDLFTVALSPTSHHDSSMYIRQSVFHPVHLHVHPVHHCPFIANARNKLPALESPFSISPALCLSKNCISPTFNLVIHLSLGDAEISSCRSYHQPQPRLIYDFILRFTQVYSVRQRRNILKQTKPQPISNSLSHTQRG